MAGVLLHNVEKSFGENRTILKDITLAVPSADMLVLLGPPESGKSLLFQIIFGTQKPTNGEIYIDTKPVKEQKPLERDTAMVYQISALYPHMSVHKNIAYNLQMHKMPEEEIEDRVMEAVHLLGIRNCLKKMPRELSEKQRLQAVIARAAAYRPKIYLLDDPLVNTSAKAKPELCKEILSLHKKLGATFIYATNDVKEAALLGKRTAVIDSGIIQQVDKWDEIQKSPNSLSIAEYVQNEKINVVDVIPLEAQGNVGVQIGKTVLLVPGKYAQVLKTYVGQKVKMLIRAKDIYIDDTPKHSIMRLQATVKARELAGGCIYTELSVYDENIYMLEASSGAYKSGVEIPIGIDMKNVHFFDCETGMVLLSKEDDN